MHLYIGSILTTPTFGTTMVEHTQFHARESAERPQQAVRPETHSALHHEYAQTATAGRGKEQFHGSKASAETMQQFGHPVIDHGNAKPPMQVADASPATASLGEKYKPSPSDSNPSTPPSDAKPVSPAEANRPVPSTDANKPGTPEPRQLPGGATETTYPDRTERQYPDGDSLTKYNDGKSVYKMNDGNSYTQYPDGTRSHTSPNGDVETHLQHGFVSHDYHDGTGDLVYPNGLTIQTNPQHQIDGLGPAKAG
jgi:hypothetical protein